MGLLFPSQPQITLHSNLEGWASQVGFPKPHSPFSDKLINSFSIVLYDKMNKTALTMIFIILLISSTSGVRYFDPNEPQDFNTGRYYIEEIPYQQAPNLYASNPSGKDFVLSSINNVFPSYSNIDLVSDGNIVITIDPLNSKITFGFDANASYGDLNDINAYWGKIDVPIGTDPEPEKRFDTLTLTSSNGSMIITGNATTDSVDFIVTPVVVADQNLWEGITGDVGSVIAGTPTSTLIIAGGTNIATEVIISTPSTATLTINVDGNLVNGGDADSLHIHPNLNNPEVMFSGFWTGFGGIGAGQTIPLKTFSANDFSSSDIVRITIYTEKVNGIPPTSAVISFRITGVTNPVLVQASTSSTIEFVQSHLRIWQDQSINDLVDSTAFWDNGNNTFQSLTQASADTNTANWITTGWTANIFLSAVPIGQQPTGWAIIERIKRVV